MSSFEERRTEGGAWGIALLGVIVATVVGFTGHGMAALVILTVALVIACAIYYDWGF